MHNLNTQSAYEVPNTIIYIYTHEYTIYTYEYIPQQEPATDFQNMTCCITL
jgi:hypothetical protein